MKLQLPISPTSQAEPEPTDPQPGDGSSTGVFTNRATMDEVRELVGVIGDMQRQADERVSGWLERTEKWIRMTKGE
jgi:hypothetical protein